MTESASSPPDVDGIPTEAIVEATIAVVNSIGYDLTTTQKIAEAAGTGVEEITRRFGDKNGCCLRAFDAVCEQLDCLLLPIYLRPDPWQERISAAAHEVGRFCEEHAERIGFAIDERFRRGRLPLGESTLRLHLDQIDSIRHEVPESGRIPVAAAEIAVGSFLEAVVSKHAHDELENLALELPALLYNIFRLYLGIEAAEDALESVQARG